MTSSSSSKMVRARNNSVYDETAPQKVDAKQWREDWDDEDINDDFAVQLKKELGVSQ